MRRRLIGILGLFAAAALAVGCGDSDPMITAKVKTRLSTDRTITTASNIDVSTQSKVVTLKGTAESDIAKERAVALARGTEGVVDVVDNLTVASPPAQGQAPQASSGDVKEKVSQAADKVAEAVDDVAITTAVKAQLLANKQVAGTRIAVDTRDGVVTLKGTVADPEQKATAIQIARDTRGVQRVEDQLMVRTS